MQRILFLSLSLGILPLSLFAAQMRKPAIKPFHQRVLEDVKNNYGSIAVVAGGLGTYLLCAKYQDICTNAIINYSGGLPLLENSPLVIALKSCRTLFTNVARVGFGVVLIVIGLSCSGYGLGTKKTEKEAEKVVA